MPVNLFFLLRYINECEKKFNPKCNCFTSNDYKIFDDYENTKSETCPITLDIIKECILTKCNHKFSKDGFLEYAKSVSMLEYIDCPLCTTKLILKPIVDGAIY